MVFLHWRVFNRTKAYRSYQNLCGFRLFSSTTVENPKSDVFTTEVIESRLKLWEKLKAEHGDRVQLKAARPIQIHLKGGDVHEGVAHQTTPHNIYTACDTGKIAGEALVARVNDQLWDLNRPLEGDCSVELLAFDATPAKQTFWRSSAFVLGAAIEQLHGSGSVSTGSAAEMGFYCDVLSGSQEVRNRLNRSNRGKLESAKSRATKKS